MIENKIIENKLALYNIKSMQDETNALKEIFQEIALSALARTDFFLQTGFQGGTCLRIIYGLQRFSEDLDFLLAEPNFSFDWKPYLDKIQEEFSNYNLNLAVTDRSKVDNSVKKAFIKEDSFGQILKLTYKRNISDIQKVQIKLEIDINPPNGSEFETKFLDFPYPYSITLQELKSLFAGKCHALLCRTYTKGRDWFDFIWYVSRKTAINYNFLENALHQTGPWEGKNISINRQWIIENFENKIINTDWESAQKDVARFLKVEEFEGLKIWNQNFFLAMLGKLENYLS